jgi:hypothetical protein
MGMNERCSVGGPLWHALSSHELGSSAMTAVRLPISAKATANTDQLTSTAGKTPWNVLLNKIEIIAQTISARRDGNLIKSAAMRRMLRLAVSKDNAQVPRSVAADDEPALNTVLQIFATLSARDYCAAALSTRPSIKNIAKSVASGAAASCRIMSAT